MKKTHSKTYTVADFALNHKSRMRSKARVIEDNIIEESLRKTLRIDSTGYNYSSKEKQKQMRAQANTIPLNAYQHDIKPKQDKPRDTKLMVPRVGSLFSGIKGSVFIRCRQCKKKYKRWNAWMNNHTLKTGHRKFKRELMEQT